MKKFLLAIALVVLLSAGNVVKADNLPGSDKVNFTFAMGWCGLGETPVSAFQTTGDGYGTRPWFNSWQLELSYNFVRLGRFNIFGGVGYESSVFLFDKPYVFINEYEYIPAIMDYYDYSTIDDNGDYVLDNYIYETRLVTRYINLVVGGEYKISGDFSVGAALLPGFNYTSRNTGLKYSCDGQDIPDYDDMSGHLQAFKMDCRLYVRYSCLGLFVQLPMTKLYKDMTNGMYPLKFGFLFKF